ncbi:PilW family protein [Shewanella marina]|uniref:PilW family protein n=1 Tax=Shewanella marina TaxID=487319 RepID=UPI0011DCDDE2|nr:PilW family protein [Shewanella marina]
MKKREQGFSLVELMVAILIGMFLTLGLMSMFSSSATNVRTTSQYNELQENGRIAMMIMAADISQVGFMADMTGIAFITGINFESQASAVDAASDCVGAGSNNSSFPSNVSGHFRRIWGYEQGVGSEPFTCLGNNVNANTDVIQIKRFSGPDVQNPNDTNRYYIATSSNRAVLFSGDQTPPNFLGRRFWHYLHHIYYIRSDGDIPVLRRQALRVGGMRKAGSFEQLVEGIENFRVLYGIDDNGDGSADSFIPAANVTDTMWDNQDFARIVAVRLYLLVRSIEQDRSYTNNVVYQLGDKTIGPLNDNYRRKVMSSTIMLDNPALIR